MSRRPPRADGGADPSADTLDEYQALQMLDDDVVKRGVSDRKMKSLRIKNVDKRMTTRERCHVCQCEYESADQVSSCFRCVPTCVMDSCTCHH